MGIQQGSACQRAVLFLNQSLVQRALQPKAAFNFVPFSGGVFPLLARLLCTSNWDEQNTLHSEVPP